MKRSEINRLQRQAAGLFASYRFALPPFALWGDDAWREAGEARQQVLREYADAGVDRVMGLLQRSADSDEPLIALAEDVRTAGLAPVG